MADKSDSLEAANCLRHAATERLLEGLTDVAELKAEVRVRMRAVHEKLDRLLLLEQKVEEHSKAIARIKTWGSALAAGIALAVSSLKDGILKTR